MGSDFYLLSRCNDCGVYYIIYLGHVRSSGHLILISYWIHEKKSFFMNT